MSLNKLISIHDAIYNTFEDTGIDIPSEVPTFMRWAVDAEKKIGSYYGWKPCYKPITGQGHRVQLPIECMSLQRVFYGDVNEDTINRCGNWAIKNLDNGPFINTSSGPLGNTADGTFSLNIDLDPSGGGFCLWDNQYTIQNNALVYGRSVDKQKFTVKYLGYEVDCDGFLLVNENHIQPLVAYIKWFIAKRSRYSPGQKMERWEIKDAESEWIMLRNQARAEDSELTPQEQQEIAALLRDPWSGIGLILDSGYNLNYPLYQ